ncbi:MAG: DUF2867 domain-containing protein [Hyphomicrobiales bacterium]
MPFPVEVQAEIPNIALPNADWADAFELELPNGERSARTIASNTLGSSPKWLELLLSVRNAVVKPFGLKMGKETASQPANSIGFFPVLEENDERIVVGLDDKHLDFRIIVELFAKDSTTTVLMTTVIRRHNLFGKIYLAVVSPFHKLIVPRVLSQAISAKRTA